MPIYRVGSVGPEVETIQRRLVELGLYSGRIDSRFGGGTESAVVAFQGASGLKPDGKVGDLTWAKLFASAGAAGAVAPAPAPAIAARPLDYRCLALSASIETSDPPPECFAEVTGDFDGQGLSFGALQFALKAGSLGELVEEVHRRHPALLDQVFHQNAGELREALKLPPDERVEWARSIQDTGRFRLVEPWLGMWKAFGRRGECQAVQVDLARKKYERALQMCAEYGFWSERAVALMYDIVVQNGSIKPVVRDQIRRDFSRLVASSKEVTELERMRIVARRRAEACLARWVDKVRVRKLTIADGHGVIHGREYDLAEDYGIRLTPFAQS